MSRSCYLDGVFHGSYRLTTRYTVLVDFFRFARKILKKAVLHRKVTSDSLRIVLGRWRDWRCCFCANPATNTDILKQPVRISGSHRNTSHLATMYGPRFRSEESDGDIEKSMGRREPHTPVLLPCSHLSVHAELYAAFGQLGQCAARFVAIRSHLAISLAFNNSTTTSSPVLVYSSSGV